MEDILHFSASVHGLIDLWRKEAVDPSLLGTVSKFCGCGEK